MALQIAQAPRADAFLVLAVEGLGDDPQEFLGAGDGHVGAEVGVGVEHGLADPLGQLGSFLLEAAVRQHHHAVVVLPPQHAAQALRGVSHRVKREEVVFPDAIRLPQELETGF